MTEAIFVEADLAAADTTIMSCGRFGDGSLLPANQCNDKVPICGRRRLDCLCHAESGPGWNREAAREDAAAASDRARRAPIRNNVTEGEAGCGCDDRKHFIAGRRGTTNSDAADYDRL